MPTFFDLQKYAATGIESADMTAFDKMRALAAFGGGKTQTLTGQPPLTFKADGTPLISWSMKGNGSQQGTPTPDNPVMPEFVGTLDGTDWTIPITCAGQTVPVYLGQTQTVRRIKKLVLDGTEKILAYTGAAFLGFELNVSDMMTNSRKLGVCTHFNPQQTGSGISTDGITFGANNKTVYVTLSQNTINTFNLSDISTIKSWLAAQYAAGTPVTIWYVLATPVTAIVNEPLCKIGDYADELHSTDAAVTIPTVNGQNTLTVDTELQPSEMTIKYRK